MTGAADGPQVPARLTHLPHSHVSNLGWNQPPDEQRAAPVPGVLQTAVRLHPALPVPFQPVLSKQGLDLLGARVVPGPRSLLLKGEAEVEGHWEACTDSRRRKILLQRGHRKFQLRENV